MTSSIPKDAYSSAPYSQHHARPEVSFSTIDNKSELYQTYDKAILTSLKSRLLGITKQLNLFPIVSTIKPSLIISNDTTLDISDIAGSPVEMSVTAATTPTITIKFDEAKKLANCHKLESGSTFYIYLNINGKTVTITDGNTAYTTTADNTVVVGSYIYYDGAYVFTLAESP